MPPMTLWEYQAKVSFPKVHLESESHSVTSKNRSETLQHLRYSKSTYNKCRNVTLTFTGRVFHYSSQRSSFYQFLSPPLPPCWLGSSYQHKKESAQDRTPHCPVGSLAILHCAHPLCQDPWVCSSLYTHYKL